MVVNDFMAAGGDGLLELTQGTSVQDTGILIRDAIASYIKKAPCGFRRHRRAGYDPDPLTL